VASELVVVQDGLCLEGGLTRIAVDPVADPHIVDNDAEIVAGVELGLTAVTNPDAETVSSLVFEEIHVTIAVTSWVVPSPYVAVAVSCSVWPGIRVDDGAVTLIDTRFLVQEGVGGT